MVRHKEALAGVNASRSFIRFSDFNRLPLDVVEKIVRESVVARRARAVSGTIPTQAELLKLWAIKEHAVQAPQAVTRTVAAVTKPAVAKPAVARAAAAKRGSSTTSSLRSPASAKASARSAERRSARS